MQKPFLATFSGPLRGGKDIFWAKCACETLFFICGAISLRNVPALPVIFRLARGDFGLVSGRNLVHGSDSEESAERELALWFQEGEILEWHPVLKEWIDPATE